MVFFGARLRLVSWKPASRLLSLTFLATATPISRLTPISALPPKRATSLMPLKRSVGEADTSSAMTSAGGVAQLIALANPNVIAGLVLIDTIAYDSFPEPGIARLKEPIWDDILTAPDFDLKKGFAKGLTRGMARADRVTTALIDAYERPFRGVEGRRAYLRAARALRTEDLTSRMGAIETLPVPTVVIWGERDVFQSVTYGQRLAEAMPNARLEIVADAGHFLPEDAPEFLAELITKFTTPSQGA